MSDGALFDESVGRGPDADTWTVGELAAHLGRLLVAALPDDVWVAGQIRNLSRANNGHVYFDLVEPTESGRAPEAQLSVTLLAPERELVNRQLVRAGGGVRMSDGVEVRIQGRIRWYAPRGSLQLRMHGIDPAFTLGRLQADRDRLLAALGAEGLLDANARVPMPLVPLRVGVVTSRGTAAHADVMAELEASGIGFEVVLADARTQGPDCGPSVARALAALAAATVDVVLLVRGGGARTDLAGFDTEQIARAIAAMPVPVLTGIGHEVDRSIADEVAHRAHKTPTAAAASVVAQVQAFGRGVEQRAASLQRAVARATRVAEARLDDRRVRAARSAERTLARADQRLAQRTARAGRCGPLARPGRPAPRPGGRPRAARRPVPPRRRRRPPRRAGGPHRRARPRPRARPRLVDHHHRDRPPRAPPRRRPARDRADHPARPGHRPQHRRPRPHRCPGARAMTDPVPADQLTYAEAVTELDAILDRLEHDEPDVDRVATDVARASALIAHCRERIASARLRVDEVAGSLAPTGEDDADDDGA
ncbi:MAG: exodeoxyribonuclease VII large subunit [Acidimicrobiales bacterium]